MTPLINKLPEELLLEILSYLDSIPPSILQIRKEPSLSLCTSHLKDHKSVSYVSKRWRRIVLPLLFRYSRLRRDIELRTAGTKCETCGILTTEQQSSTQSNARHAQLFRNAAKESTGNPEKFHALDSLHWAARFHHAMQDYLNFIQSHHLERSVHSFVLETVRTMSSQGRFPHQSASEDHRYRAAADLWVQLLLVVNPSRVVIVAPPADLACLTNCAVDLFGEWAFSDMDYQILELKAGNSIREEAYCTPNVIYPRSDGHLPPQYPGIAESSILRLKPWTHLGLNEGSFLKAYGTYEYFERGPPSLVYSIKNCFSFSRRTGRREDGALIALRSFHYTAILPFANHLNFHGILPYIKELDVKLAPDPDSGILSDRERVGKAELGDCWQELFTGYQVITRPFRTHDLPPDGSPRLRRFICRDMQTPALQDDLDEVFTWLCLPCWAEMKPGVFKRLCDSPDFGQPGA